MEVAFCPLMGGQEGDTGDFHSCSPFGEHSSLETLPELRRPVFSS